MRRIERVSDVVELISEKSFYFGGGGLLCYIASGLIFWYRGGGTLVPLAYLLLTLGMLLLGFATHSAVQLVDVSSVGVECPYCQYQNELTSAPDDDFTCRSCNRLIPILDQQPMPVSQVRCGFCNTLNFYSEKTEILLCEECNREIPIAGKEDDPTKPRKKLSAAYVVATEDEHMYELVLTGKGHKQEELIASLQHMLALNRNQVKQMLDELPVTLLTGINRRKAEMLQAQLNLHDAETAIRQLSDPVM
ncbi:MAG: hypothetical protein SFX74_01365 [Fimbriimonadaceae bacterium]|nr:hypothetical protein [Fimbriimonadaceae bacterium]